MADSRANLMSYIANIILGLAFLVCLITGVIKVPWLFNIRYTSLRLVSSIHDISGIVFAVFALIHLVFKISWYKETSEKLREKPKYIQVRRFR